MNFANSTNLFILILGIVTFDVTYVNAISRLYLDKINSVRDQRGQTPVNTTVGFKKYEVKGRGPGPLTYTMKIWIQIPTWFHEANVKRTNITS